jgi:hypothetical protein
MPRAIRYGRGPKYKEHQGRVLQAPPLKGIAWWIGGVRYPKDRKYPPTLVQLISLPVGHVSEENWNTLRYRLEKGMLVIVGECSYARWEDAALAIYGDLAWKQFKLNATEKGVAALVATIESDEVVYV